MQVLILEIQAEFNRCCWHFTFLLQYFHSSVMDRVAEVSWFPEERLHIWVFHVDSWSQVEASWVKDELTQVSFISGNASEVKKRSRAQIFYLRKYSVSYIRILLTFGQNVNKTFCWSWLIWYRIAGATMWRATWLISTFLIREIVLAEHLEVGTTFQYFKCCELVWKGRVVSAS